jgi:hypothetical protein
MTDHGSGHCLQDFRRDLDRSGNEKLLGHALLLACVDIPATGNGKHSIKPRLAEWQGNDILAFDAFRAKLSEAAPVVKEPHPFPPGKQGGECLVQQKADLAVDAAERRTNGILSLIKFFSLTKGGSS